MGNCGSPFGGAPFFNVDVDRLGNAQRIEAGVFKKTFVLHRRHGVDQVPREVLKAEDAPLLPLLVEQIRDQFWRQRDLTPRCLVRQGHDRRGPIIVDRQEHAFHVRACIRTAKNPHRIAFYSIPPQPIVFGLAITGIPQGRDDARHRKVIAHRDRLGRCKDHRSVWKRPVLQLIFDEIGIVVVKPDRRQNRSDPDKNRGTDQKPEPAATMGRRF